MSEKKPDGGSVLPMLQVLQCPEHKFNAVSIQRGNNGRRLTESKCCGGWKVKMSFYISEGGWREAAEICLKAADDVRISEDAMLAERDKEST